jgi:flavin-binding protein dodecin
MPVNDGGGDSSSIAAAGIGVVFGPALMQPGQYLVIDALAPAETFVLLLEGSTDLGSTWNTVAVQGSSTTNYFDAAAGFVAFANMTRYYSGWYRVSIKNTGASAHTYRVWVKAVNINAR